jgi:hypothetical protein
LSLALPGHTLDELRGLTLSQRDQWLLELRGRVFGQRISSIATCPTCGAEAELEFEVDAVRQALRADTANASSPGNTGEIRAATCGDLVDVEPMPPGNARRDELLRRCIRSTEEGGLPASLEGATNVELSAAILACDPAAELTIPVTCQSCRQPWSSRFDVVQFLWQELDAWAKRMLAEVHLLASAYGWSERAIVALSPWRRQAYLEMLRQ